MYNYIIIINIGQELF